MYIWYTIPETPNTKFLTILIKPRQTVGCASPHYNTINKLIISYNDKEWYKIPWELVFYNSKEWYKRPWELVSYDSKEWYKRPWQLMSYDSKEWYKRPW